MTDVEKGSLKRILSHERQKAQPLGVVDYFAG